MTISNLPPPVSAYITATNQSDIEALMATFAEDALVNDHRSEFNGRDAVRRWAQREIVGDRVPCRLPAPPVAAIPSPSSPTSTAILTRPAYPIRLH